MIVFKTQFIIITAMAKRNVTYKDIAKYTGFSKTTISRYFNDPDSVMPANRHSIAEALEVLGYRENKLAKILANGVTGFVGVIVPMNPGEALSRITDSLLRIQSQYGYRLLITPVEDDADSQLQAIEELISYQLEGLIVLSPTLHSSMLMTLDIPVVTIAREGEYVDSVSNDNDQCGELAGILVSECGCNIAIFIGDSHDGESGEMALKFHETCTARGLKCEVLLRDFSDKNVDIPGIIQELFGYVEYEYLVQRKGVFVHGDIGANLFINNIISKYSIFPDEYRVLGFGNSDICDHSFIKLSSIGPQQRVMARTALDLISRRRSEGIPQEKEHKKIPPVLMRRETTK